MSTPSRYVKQTYIDICGVEIFDAILLEDFQELFFLLQLSKTSCSPDDLGKLGVWRHVR